MYPKSNAINPQGEFIYAVFDPLQVKKPEGRTKDIISYSNISRPTHLDTVSHSGCDTLWKCFKRSVWTGPTRNYLGQRDEPTQSSL